MTRVRRDPTLNLMRFAAESPSTPPVTETFDDPPPKEVFEMVARFVSPKTKKPARVSVSADMSIKDYGCGWGAQVSLSFDVDPDEQVIDNAMDLGGQLVRSYLAEQLVAGEQLYRELNMKV